MRLALTVAIAVALGVPTPASAEDVVVERDRIEPDSLVGGDGWLLWVYHPSDGGLRLRAMPPDGAPHDVATPRFTLIQPSDIGRGPSGEPTAVYTACRSTCHLYKLDLRRGRTKLISMPRTPHWCTTKRPVIDRRVFVVRSGARRRCRAGIHELRRGRLLLRQRGSSINRYDVRGDRLAFERVTSRLRTEVLVRRLGHRRGRVVTFSDLRDWDSLITYMPTWQGSRLWLGVHVELPEGPNYSWVQRYSGAKTECRQDAREFVTHYEPYVPEPHVWAFAGGAVYYTIYVAARDRVGTNAVEIRRRTDPPVELVRCP